MKIGSIFGGLLLGRFITKFVKKKYGIDLTLVFTKLEVRNDKKDTYGKAEISFSIPTEQIKDLAVAKITEE